MNMLCIDVGTTASKAQVFDEEGEILFYRSVECPLITQNGERYVDIVAITSAVKELIKEAATSVEIDSVAFSSFGESCVVLDENDEVIAYPMLYTDTRGESEAKEIEQLFGRKSVFERTGTVPHSMYTVSKLMWLKNNDPRFETADKVFLIGDYFGYLLTGKRVIDYSLAARTGVFNVKDKCFDKDMLKAIDLPIGLFSTPMPIGTVVGTVSEKAAKELSLTSECVLVLGGHDQVLACIGSGVTRAGECADGMGTVECITAIFDKPKLDIAFGNMGYCVVPFLDDLYCTYMFNYTSNVVVNWFRKDVLHGYKGEYESQFEYLEGSSASSDVLLLPYFAGSATPKQDMNAKGAILNLTDKTRDVDIYRAILEGTSFEMKVNLETGSYYGINAKVLTATGGGANSRLWLQIKSDILGLPVKTLRSSEGGLCGLAILSAVALSIANDVDEAIKIFVRFGDTVTPSDEYKETYDKKYAKYKRLYDILKEIN